MSAQSLSATILYDSRDYKRSRAAYSAQCAFEYFISILVSDAFLAKLLSEIGIKDSAIGIISSFISVAFLFQLGTLILVRHTKSIKRTGTFFNTLGALLFMCLYLLPFLPFGSKALTVCAAGLLLAAYFCNYIVTSMIFKWGNSFVDPKKRGTYSAGKEMISLVSGIAFTLILGYVFDRFEASGRIRDGFLFMAITVFVVALLNFVCLLLIKENDSPTEQSSVDFNRVLDNTFRNRAFLRTVLADSVWKAANYMTIGFMGIYKTKELALSVGAVQIINMVANMGRFSLSMPFGKFANKYGFARGLELGFGIVAVGFLINAFCTPTTAFLVVLFTILYNLAQASIVQNSLNITYSYVKSDCFVQASAIKNSISGIVGFVASLLGSRILESVQANGNTVFGMPLYGQQLLSLISFVIMVLLILYVHFSVAKQKAMLQ